MAFVLIQHLDPTHTSFLSEALVKTTEMPVLEITDGMKLKPNHVYTIPPSGEVGILRGQFTLFRRDEAARKLNMSVDFFFRSLAAECGSQAIGVVLSGNATDGTEGLRAIKAENGVTLVQDPKSAKFDGMPKSAVGAGVVDFCLPVPELAQELVHLAHHPYISKRLNEPFCDPKSHSDLQKIFVLLRNLTGIDFSEYKSPTIGRRLARRMALLKIDTLKEYIKFLQKNASEAKALSSDVLIHVTSFFRDPEVFENLKSKVFPELIKNRAPDQPIRIWVAGCSSGEEVYSLAIALLEFLEERSSLHAIQMFGSDLSETMIEKARAGLYAESALREVGPERLARFFVKTDGGYRINRSVRDLCIFVRHDLARDPPFSKLDLVTCRNVLIYFGLTLQKRIISILHYCLNQRGFLLLGRTEGTVDHNQLFSTFDKTNRVFSKVSAPKQLRSTLPHRPPPIKSAYSSPVHIPPPVLDVAKQVDNLMLSRYAPAGVLVNERMEVLQYRGKTGIYLEHPSGQPQLNLLKMVRDGLFSSVKMAFVQAKNKKTVVRKQGLEFRCDGTTRACNLVVVPFVEGTDHKEPLFLILFEETKVPKEIKGKNKAKGKAKGMGPGQTEKLELELRTTRDYLETLNEEHQKTNDTLNSMNEELVSGNEELQSMNEELETAKEELQSTNEELTTVNDELQTRNLETALVNDDLINLLNSVEIPILILDINRCIRRFTPKARNIMNLLATDIGRHIGDIQPNIIVEKLDEKIQEVIESVTPWEKEVQDREGKWHRLQIRPYKTVDHKISGAVLSLVNVDLLRRAVIDAEWVRDYSTSIVEAVQIPLLVLDKQMNIVSANQAFYRCFGTTKRKTENKSLYETALGQSSKKPLKKLLQEMLEAQTSFQNVEMTCDIPSQGKAVVSLSAQSIQFPGIEQMILLAIEDVTERGELLRQAQEAKEDADKANLTKDLFLATLSHELRTPLTSLILQAQMLRRSGMDATKIKRASLSIERAAKIQTQLIEDLLDVSRIVTGKLKMEFLPVDLGHVIRSAIETVAPVAESKAVAIISNLNGTNGTVMGDVTRLQQVIWNLLTNAIKFTAKAHHGKVTINLDVVDDHAQIQVIDTGIGIDAEFLPHVFSRFTQAESTSTRTHGGLGLGLAIVRHLVELHHGTVNVESEGKDKGSTFTITLPLSHAASSETGSKDSKSVPPWHSSSNHQMAQLDGLRILLVEDDLGAREALSEVLSSAGAEVKAAESAADALHMLKDFSPDELVMDIAMPDEDGYSLLRKIRNLPSMIGKKIPALALTALASDRDRKAAFSAGFQMHIPKPIDIERLTGALLKLSGRGQPRH